MSFHGHSHHRSTSSTAHPTTSAELPSTASGMYQAAQTLGSIGAPMGNLRVATSGAGSTSAGTDSFYAAGGPPSGMSSAGYHTPGSGGGGVPVSGHITSQPSSAPTAGMSQSHQFETPRRSTFGRQPEELHLHGAVGTPGQHGSLQQTPSHHQQHQSHIMSQGPGGAAGPPHINLHQATPQSASYGKSSLGGTLPGVLQPGSSSRPAPLSNNTAPATVPTMLQIQTQNASHAATPKSANLSHTHGYSRSSPSGGFDSQKYVPYPGTPEAAKYATPSNPKYTPSQSQHGAISNSPLGLADIRPSGGLGLSDGPTSANPYSYDDESSVPSTSNYLAPWAIYAFDWCKWSVHPHGGGAGGGNSAGKVAVGSYLEDGHNYIQILDTEIIPPSNAELASPGAGATSRLEFTKLAEATYTYPVTRILWEPPSSQKQSTDLLATSGDHLRLWSLPANATPSNTTTSTSNSITRTSNLNNRDPAPFKLTPLALLSNSKSPEHTAPLTSLDWNTLSPSLIITSSIDTTCTIWDIPTLTAKTQLIAHDKEVFDVRFCANSVDVFVSCGADGSVRMFDLRSLEHSTIIYEPSEKTDKGTSPGNMSPTTAQQTMSYAPPLLRLSASPHDAHLLATFSQDSNIIRILDVRQPGQALLELRGHAASINCIEWSPSRRGMLASGADDSLVLLWDLLSQSSTVTGNPSGTGTGVNGVAGGTGSGAAAGGSTAASATVGTTGDIGRSPSGAWRCDYEVSNISWAPPSLAASHTGGDWVGVAAGRGIWGVKL
ncbi:MAG: hypothetical protein M1823_005350 [Watsoniomyces obsoletus]|nr:MAG: hypothetical protein M1823_005350 [Watsoniomyces obsoletus]